ncbi:MAG: hypothetical protein PHY92_03950 [Alphaproteobacteria bacterium]|nr:hypothetical protein [Alphaproteobacteria bacterium]
MKNGIMLALASLLFVLAAPSASLAAAHCYSPTEVEAEQLLRLHSELMVITVTCHVSSTGQDLVGAYTGFTRNNIGPLHEAEQTMISYYKKAYGGKGIDKLDRLRTQLANEYGQEIADVSAPAFCKAKRDKVIALHKADSGALHGEVMTISARTFDPPCSSLQDVAGRSL